MYRLFRLLAALLAVIVGGAAARADVRIKDITTVEGARGNELLGVGLVVGLNNTGGTDLATQQMAIDMLRRLDVSTVIARQSLLDNVFKSNNIAMVTVTAELPEFARKGSKLDVVVSAFGGVTSLEGGTLIRTPLSGSDGQVYAVAQGPLSIGGFRVRGVSNGQLNHPTNARIPGGAFVEREALGEINQNGVVRLLLREPDYSTSAKISQAINQQFPAAAKAINPGMVQIRVPVGMTSRVTDFVGEVGLLTVTPDAPARVVINERTGTVVVGHNVRVTATSITHANFVINPNMSSALPPGSRGAPVPIPNPPSLLTPPEPDGGPGVPPPPDERSSPARSEQTYTVAELVRVLNSLGATPRDLIAIFQILKQSGSLHAELVVM